MKAASKILYTIGQIFSYIALVLTIIAIVFGIIFTVGGSLATTLEDSLPAGVTALAGGITFLVVGIVYLVIYVILIISARKAKRALGNGVTNNGPHIWMIVLGAISWDIFYLLGGIFGLIAEHTRKR